MLAGKLYNRYAFGDQAKTPSPTARDKQRQEIQDALSRFYEQGGKPQEIAGFEYKPMPLHRRNEGDPMFATPQQLEAYYSQKRRAQEYAKAKRKEAYRNRLKSRFAGLDENDVQPVIELAREGITPIKIANQTGLPRRAVTAILEYYEVSFVASSKKELSASSFA